MNRLDALDRIASIIKTKFDESYNRGWVHDKNNPMGGEFDPGGYPKPTLRHIPVLTNILPPLPVHDFVALDIVAADTHNHAGGTMQPSQYTCDIYIAATLPDKGYKGDTSLYEARKKADKMAAIILDIPRLYAHSIKYGEDVIGANRFSLVQIRCTFPL